MPEHCPGPQLSEKNFTRKFIKYVTHITHNFIVNTICILNPYYFVYSLPEFENELYDVLKFDVKREKSLFDCNKDLMKFPHTTDYPDYHPHLTISYLKPGKGKKYVNKFKYLKYVLIPEKAVYSLTDGFKHNIKI